VEAVVAKPSPASIPGRDAVSGSGRGQQERGQPGDTATNPIVRFAMCLSVDPDRPRV